MSTRNTVLLSGSPAVNDSFAASAGIEPGMLVEISSGALRPHSTAGGIGARLIAIERATTGRGLDSAYVSGEVVPFARCRPGDKVFVTVPSGQNISVGAYLESAGTGRFRAYASGEIMLQAAETIGAVTATTRLAAWVV